MLTIYRLKDDTKHISDVQIATLSRKYNGIKQTHGLFGSPDWWTNIEKGLLRSYTLRGIISSVYMASMNDWPEFEITTNDEKKERFTRETTPPALDSEYMVGRKVEIDYVWQQHKHKLPKTPLDHKVVIEIRSYD